jgi:hypothetical protein
MKRFRSKSRKGKKKKGKDHNTSALAIQTIGKFQSISKSTKSRRNLNA